jgi:2',3'-cyclic-nucleotide 2'-phosphodiesterase (5'-nucleotidase family)
MDRTTVRHAAVVLALGLLVLGAATPGRETPSLSGFSRTIPEQQDARSEAAEQDESASPRAQAPLTILQINDVYSTVPVDGAGGVSRVATLKQKVAAARRTPLLVLAGDFLSPSVASSVFKGEQMVAALNAAGLDLATLGNHEFDFGVDVLIQRMGEAKWQWVVSNVIDTNTGKPIGGALPYLVKTFGSLKVGFIGLCLTTSEISREKLTHVRMVDPIEAAGRYLPALRRQGAQVIVAITHLKFSDDRALAQKFPQIDLIIGGHEHYPITATENRTLISKAGSDAKFVARIDVNRQSSAIVERFFELVPITGALADEPRTAAVVKSYEDRLGTELNTVVATSQVPLDADTLRIRAGETNLGDLFADAMRAAATADITIVNAGSIRGDRVYPAGALTRRTIIEMHPFGGFICKVAMPGRIVLQALNSGVSKLPTTAGQFPQVSGLTMRVASNAPVDRRVSDVRVGGQPLDPNRIYTVAITDYMLMGGDDYAMFANQRVMIGPEAGDLIVSALEKYLTDRRDIAPAVDDRIVIAR